MRFSTVLPFAAAVLALDIQDPQRRAGCENANCANVPAPKVIRGVMSVRDDRCQYSCHLKRLRAAAMARQQEPKPADVPVVPGAEESPEEAKQYDEDFVASHTLDLNESGSAIAALLSGQTNNMKKRQDGPVAPLAAKGQFDVAVTSIPRRSEGLCKFAIDVLPNAEDATPAISCRAAGTQMLENFPRSTAAILAARLAVEYDSNCELNAQSTYTTADGKASFPVFSPEDDTDASGFNLKGDREFFFLSCGAVFASQPVSGSSGSGTAAQVKMIRDSRGLMPILAENFPAHVFVNIKGGPFGPDSIPPWMESAQKGF
ncbi:hypothetical protein NHJ13734_009335 [Beauveria thailandica]